MRRALASLAVLIAATGAAWADAPFIPEGRAPPDHVVTMVVRTIHRKDSSSQIHTHHAGWTRIDEQEGRRIATRWFGHKDSVLVRAWRNDAGGLRLFDIHRDYVPFADNKSFKTGETRAVLGESCEVWNAARTEPGSTELARLSCVTQDGIELAFQDISQRSTVIEDGKIPKSVIISGEATRIERRPVAAVQVRPPVEALDLATWAQPTDGASSTSGAPGDVEVVIESEPGTTTPATRITRTVRRHHPWALTDEHVGEAERTLQVRNDASNFSASLYFRSNVVPHMLVMGKSSPPPPQTKPQSTAYDPVDLHNNEVVLGERCAWFDMMPNVMDAGLHECRTADGVVLKAVHFSRGSKYPLAATHLTRRPLALSDVLPPAEMLVPRNWNLPD